MCCIFGIDMLLYKCVSEVYVLRFNKVKGKMRELGYTQAKLASKLGITEQTLNAKLNGRSEFLLKEALKLISVLGRDVLNDFF